MSQSQSDSNRLTALDGLRGLSSLLVLATHLKLDIPLLTDQITFLPLRLVVRTIMNTGNISVGFFFILCGFLMAYLYEDPYRYVSFIQKRYLRIFTVLIVAVVISFSVMYLGVQTITFLLLILVAVPIMFRFSYEVLLKLLKNKFLIVFFIFILGSQVIIASINYFVVFRIGVQEFYSLPKVLYTSFMFATNYTLTFIFGDYIPMVDGGYWSLVSEVMFYLMYPLLAWLLIKPIRRLSQNYWILWYFASMVTCFGLALLFKNFLTFDTAHIHYAHFFTVGMIIALAYKDQNKSFQKTVHFFETPAGQVTSIFLYIFPVASAFWLGYISNIYTKYLVAYGLAPFMGLAVIALLSQKNILSRFLRIPLFIFLGAISFPLYVIHSPIVHVLWQTMSIESNPTRWIPYIIFASILSLVAAYYLHIVIEKFYFVVTKQTKRNTEIQTPSRRQLSVKLVLSSFVICLVMIFVAFQQDFSLLSMVKSHSTSTLTIESGTSDNYSLLSNNKIRGSFLAYENKLGIVTMHLKHVGIIEEDASVREKQKSNVLFFRIKEKGAHTWLHESQHVGWKISAEEPYPFGFPEYENSKNTWFEFEIESTNATENDHMIVLMPSKPLRTVYKVPKSTIINEPSLIVPILQNKIYGAFSQREAQIVFGIYLFTMWFVWFVQYKSKIASSRTRFGIFRENQPS
jgi:peptidoglycan/LPS O-acetylase OafA/YrhL